MALDESIQNALRQVKYPGFSRDIISFGLVQEITVEGRKATVRLNLTTADAKIPAALKKDVETALQAVEGLDQADVQISVQAPKQGPSGGMVDPQRQGGIPGVKAIIAVSSGKGGVGKSTFAVNLACAFQHLLEKEGKSKAVGIMDCDIYGPTIPLMMGISSRPYVEENQIIPLENFGLQVMSMGFLVDQDTPVVWRGPMIMKTIQQFAHQVKWGELDILVIDLPPGTGDAHLSLVQTIPLDGAVVVTTPQPASYQVARRGAMMFAKVNVPILGVAENMSYLEDETTGVRQTLFGEGGGQITADSLDAPFLGKIPLDPAIRISCDNGIPLVISHPDKPAAKEFFNIAAQLINALRSRHDEPASGDR